MIHLREAVQTSKFQILQTSSSVDREKPDRHSILLATKGPLQESRSQGGQGNRATDLPRENTGGRDPYVPAPLAPLLPGMTFRHTSHLVPVFRRPAGGSGIRDHLEQEVAGQAGISPHRPKETAALPPPDQTFSEAAQTPHRSLIDEHGAITQSRTTPSGPLHNVDDHSWSAKPDSNLSDPPAPPPRLGKEMSALIPSRSFT